MIVRIEGIAQNQLWLIETLPHGRAAETDPHADNVRILHEVQASYGPRLGTLRVWWQRWTERRRFARMLPSMPDETLKDFGMKRFEALKACNRPFWRA